MDRSQWKKWVNKSNFALLVYGLLIGFRPEPLALWLREHNPNFLPEIVTYCVATYSISLAIIYIPLKLISYLKKQGTKPSL
ncbi:hypothetical protein [Xenorhabdus entomophaga]|uniref:hypothetical protein n=1 Tax=Xenorhabdus entomophaga TaxID=3136257 RepID=UPI0030F38785